VLCHVVQACNKMAYHNAAFATQDAMRVNRLHTHMPGWSDANIAFMRSGGYSISSRIPDVKQPTLVLWGRQDEILEPKYAMQFEATLQNGNLHWIEECGHCGHLEKPTETAARILEFIASRATGAHVPAVAPDGFGVPFVTATVAATAEASIARC